VEKLNAFTPHGGQFALRAAASTAGHKLHFRFELRDPASEVVGGPVSGLYTKVARLDGLWQRTCFEAFFAEEGSKEYWELNVAPDGSAWNLYRFEGYRVPQPPTVSNDFTLEKISIKDGAVDCWLVPARKTAALEASLCAVVNTAAGKHYLAVAHAGGKPDFHLRSGFCVRLAALA
jgi:hypothetical protein